MFIKRANFKYFGKISMAKIKKQWLAMTAEVFTAKELQALVTFYGSKQGMAIRDKMPVAFAGQRQDRGRGDDRLHPERASPHGQGKRCRGQQASKASAPRLRPRTTKRRSSPAAYLRSFYGVTSCRRSG